MSRLYKVGFARLDLEGLWGAEHASFDQALRDAWRPGAAITRYGRTWRISGPRNQDEDVVTGRIGFVREAELATLDWDERRLDFVRGAAPGGTVIPFGIHIPERLVVFQLVSGQVRPTSFTGAFESLLTSGGGRWLVTQLVERMEYEQWSSTVEHVTGFRFRIERPNPHYHDNDVAEQLLEELRLAVATVQGQGEDVDDGNPTFDQLLDHVRRQYGSGTVRGTEEDGHESEWRSSDGGVVPAVERVESDNEEELPEEELPSLFDRIFRRRAVYAETNDARDEDDV